MLEPFSEARVAVVDGNRNFQQLLRGMLRQIGFRHVEVFGDPAAAMTHVVEVAVDLIFVDLVMPGRNGVEWVREARRRADLANPEMGMVMMTGHAVRSVLEPAVAAGIDAFLVKPIAPDTLLRHARRVLSSRAPYVPGPDGYWGPDSRELRRRLRALDVGLGRRVRSRLPPTPVAPAPSVPLPRALPGLDVEIADRRRYHADLAFLD
ncbi:MAG: response regulator [Hyphomicrobiales bacterium]|nr:response regulator [Hyphomicrobiales bacterium]